MKCLYPPFAVHKHKLLNLLSPDKSWRSALDHTLGFARCKLRASHCWEPGSSLQQPHKVLPAQDVLDTFIWIYLPPELFHQAQDQQIRPHTMPYSTPACVSVRIRLSALPVVFNTSHWTKAGCVISSRKVSPRAFHPLHLVLSAWKLFWRLGRWRRFQGSAECR